MRSGGKAVARRASALLMSALLAFSTCPVEAMAQEQDDLDGQPGQELVDNTEESNDTLAAPNQAPSPEEQQANEAGAPDNSEPQAVPEDEAPVEEEPEASPVAEEAIEATEEEQADEVTVFWRGFH